MISLVSLLVAAALVSQHSGFEANARQIGDSLKLTMDNNLQPNVIAPIKRPRRLKKFVHVWSPPAEEVTRGAGERVDLKCVVMGNPPPSIRWLKNGQPIQDPEEEVNDILPLIPSGLGQLTSKLVITSTIPGEDQYTCEGVAGELKDSANSIVYTIPSEDDEDLLALQKLFFPSKPTITYFYNELFQDIGSVALLPCRVHSFTKAQIFWQDKNKRLIYGNNRMKVLPSGDLFINGLRFTEDMGNFTCFAKNAYGKDAAVTFVYPNKV